MKLTLEMAQKMMDDDGNLDLSGSSITSLPDNLTVGGSLYLSGSSIKTRTVKHKANGDNAHGR